MKLYHEVDRVLNDLAAAGFGLGGALDANELARFDQYHYFGTDAVDEAINGLSLGPGSAVVEIGGGIGGPARRLASAARCHVSAIELQPDLNSLAADLTARCGLSELVDHIEGDALDGVVGEGVFDAVVSWLTFLHIADRPLLYRECARMLRPGGSMYVEDYHRLGTLSQDEVRILAEDVFCHRVPTLAEYETELSAAGFVDIELTDVTVAWRLFVADRFAEFRAARSLMIDRHGEELVDGLDHFYASINDLFSGGNLGGLRLTARLS